MTKPCLDISEVQKLEASASNLRDQLLIRVLFRTGCRTSEVLALTVDDIDFTQESISIQHLKTRVKLACDGLRLLEEHLGHVSFNTTAKYRKEAGEELKQWYNKLWDEGAKTDGS